jgi:3D (Asp-Asp-Asp) domain-containing protein
MGKTMSMTRRAWLLLAATVTAAAKTRRRWQKFTASAYSVEGKTASGKQTREGRTVAADPAVLPLGTRIQVRDAGRYSGTYVVHDSGPKVKGREIDIFIGDPAEAKKFGRKQVRVLVLETPKETAGN